MMMIQPRNHSCMRQTLIMAAVGGVAAEGKFSAALDDLAKIEASGEEILTDKHQVKL